MACNAADQARSVGWEDPLEKEMATCSLPGKSHGQRSLVGYSAWGRKESDMTERLHLLILHMAVRLLTKLFKYSTVNACSLLLRMCVKNLRFF